MKKITYLIFGISCIMIGLYPINYFLADGPYKLLSAKSAELLANQIYTTAFYLHITFGGIALLIGWVQFSKKLRENYLNLHRVIGKIYVFSVMISGPVGLYIAYFASGGMISKVGFSIGAIIWTTFTYLGFRTVLNGNIEAHRKFMIYSYAGTFGAVTLRVWLPILIAIIGSFKDSYPIVVWLSWVPNLFVAYFIVNKKEWLKSIYYNFKISLGF